MGACPDFMGWCPPPFLTPQEALLHICIQGSLPGGGSALCLYFCRAQILPLALSLEYLGENKA